MAARYPSHDPCASSQVTRVSRTPLCETLMRNHVKSEAPEEEAGSMVKSIARNESRQLRGLGPYLAICHPDVVRFYSTNV